VNDFDEDTASFEGDIAFDVSPEFEAVSATPTTTINLSGLRLPSVART
jgi:hypothetical protein